MILVYTPKITARLNFIFRHIFNNVLLVDVKFTSQLEEFIAFNGAKFSYADKALGKEFYVKSHPLLFQQSIKDIEVKLSYWDRTPVFFEVQDSSIPFDIFAAGFYLLSRYEEYFPHKLDMHGRYDYKNSVLSRHKLLNMPILEIWVEKFKFALQEKYPDLQFPEKSFYFEPLINVSMARLFQHKSFLRQFFGGINDILHFRLLRFIRRNKVLFFGKKDPYDTFDEILRIKNKYKHPLTFFHLLSGYNLFDHNISKNKNTYRRQIKFTADYGDTGLLASYYSSDDEGKIEKEIKDLEDIIHRDLQKIRAHFNRISIPNTYQIYNNEEIKHDYSMGYNHKLGFRAGTCTPFRFYDIENETETSLVLHPVSVSDVMLHHQYRYSYKKALRIMIEQGELIRQYGGHYYPVFHNFILSDEKEWKKWNDLYINIIKHFSAYAKK